MSSVTGRIKEIKQPNGGYIKPSLFSITECEDDKLLFDAENIHSIVTGIAVDYLTRYIMNPEKKEIAFKISLMGAHNANRFIKNSSNISLELLNNIVGLDDNSIINACKLVTFDVWLRNPASAAMAKGYKETNPDKETVNNIRIMVERSLEFWKKQGEIIADGFTFEVDGYTKTVNSGDGDYLTADTLWDFKVSKAKPTNKNTLQLMMYWIMGQHSGKQIYENISKIGIFNPRLNIEYLLNVADIPQDTINTIEQEVICYK